MLAQKLNELFGWFLAKQLTANLPITFLKPTSHYQLQPARVKKKTLVLH